MEPKFEKKYYLKKFGTLLSTNKLLTWKELEYFLNLRPLMTSKRVQILGTDEEFRWSCSPWALDVNCYPSSLLKTLILNHVCYLRDMSRSTKNINAFAKHVEDRYNIQVDAHVYFSLNNESEHPFGVHYDESHNIIVQCEGKTNFKVWDKINPEQMPQRTHLNPILMGMELIMDVIMNPGDAISIPAFYPHLALSQSKRLSVSFPFTPQVEGTHYETREWIKL